jgi:hypothetical protein
MNIGELQIPLANAVGWLTEVWSSMTWKGVLESSFTTSLVGAAAGAWAGAWAAQKIAEKAKLREEFVREIQSVNVALLLAHSTTNKYLAFKKQHVRDLGDRYAAQRAAYQEFVRKRRSGEIPTTKPFELGLDLKSLTPVFSSIQVLREHVCSNVHVAGRPLSLVTTMEGIDHTLNGLLERRNAMVEEFRRLGGTATEALINSYLGLGTAGRTDSTYADLVKGIVDYNDDLIFFGTLLCEDLVEHGQEVRRRLTTTFGVAGAPRVAEVNFGKAESDGLIPQRGNYQTWFDAFQKLPPPPTLWGRLSNWIRRSRIGAQGPASG